MDEAGNPNYPKGKFIASLLKAKYPDLKKMTSTGLASMVGRYIVQMDYEWYARTHGGATYRRKPKVLLSNPDNRE